MKQWIKKGAGLLFSYPAILVLLALLAMGGALATFVESYYDTQSAKHLVYEAKWYEAVMILLTLSMAGLIYRARMWRRLGAFLVHIAFVVILIGAGLTRYFGYEGIIHIREGKSEKEMISVLPYLQVEAKGQRFSYPLTLGQLGSNDFLFRERIDGQDLVLTYEDYRFDAKGELATLWIKARYGKEERILKLQGGAGWIEEPEYLSFDDLEVAFVWGSKVLSLPFALKLNEFQLERYPGSKSPSSYASEVEVMTTRGESLFPYRIFMNHPLHFEGYTFFQSSYDLDEKGTVLEVNRDPGKWPTYLGYFLLCAGFVLNFFTQGSRFLYLKSYLQKSQLLWIAIFLSLDGGKLWAEDFYMKSLRQNTLEHAKEAFGTLLVQDQQGRIKPMSTEALEIVNKLTTQSSLYGLSAEQLVLGMITSPDLWQEIPLVKVTNKQIKAILSLPEESRYMTFAQAFDEKGAYKLAQAVNFANQKPQSKRGVFENDLIKTDERLNIAYLTFKGVLFRFLPLPQDENRRWVDASEAFGNSQIPLETRALLSAYFEGLQEGISKNQWESAKGALEQIKAYQREHAQEILPSSLQIQAEVLYNQLALFKRLIPFYFLVGLGAFGVAILFLFANRRWIGAERAVVYLLGVLLVVHTFALALRWYVSGHAPWSDSYESMVYIGWSAALAGMVVFRRSILSLSAAAILAGIVMLVAHMSFVNPQITNLVPVLKSYWLSIHVSVITASYGFLGLGALLGLMSLLIMAFKNSSNEARFNAQIRALAAINEISLIIGLSLLTIGNFFGGIWANESWGRYWGWDPKETWSYVSILVYALILHMRFVPKIYSIFSFSLASVVGFGSILMTYFGVNFYLTGMHSYAASGESPAIPLEVYGVILCIGVLSALAYRRRKVGTI
ncbi:cytochrome c biogenesis protein CcsA [Wolinella succinogenes]|uniref:cytochrome c biogenesis protein CcsA n=1 Tax=Wolinella succinogenes TaxID=844 RepID=UPI002FC88F30